MTVAPYRFPFHGACRNGYLVKRGTQWLSMINGCFKDQVPGTHSVGIIHMRIQEQIIGPWLLQNKRA
jgi:hypothetical protein